MPADLRWLTRSFKIEQEQRALEQKVKEGKLSQREIQREVDAIQDKIDDYNADVKRHNAREMARAERRRKGGCFISTAIMEALGKDDQCQELSLLRQFRDKFLLASSEGQIIVDHYYEVAPKLLDKLRDRSRHERDIYYSLYERFLCPAIQQIEEGNNNEAVVTYKGMVLWLEQL